MVFSNLFKYWTYRVFAPGAVLRTTYESFQELLEYDALSHEGMAVLESLYYQDTKRDCCFVRRSYDGFAKNVLGMVKSLEKMSPGSFVTLNDYYRKFDFYSRFLLAPPRIDSTPPFVCSLAEADGKESLVGGKGAQLATLANKLNLPIPRGFAITSNCFNYFIEYNDLRRPVDNILADIESSNPHSLEKASAKINELLTGAEIPPAVSDALHGAWENFSADFIHPSLVAVRSSSVNEDGSCSFAGQYRTLLHIDGEELIDAWRKVIASKYTPEALAYRINTGLGDEETGMAALVLEMIDARVSGVLYTADPAGGGKDQISIHAVQGTGDALVSGQVIPQSYDGRDDDKSGEGVKLISGSELAVLRQQGKVLAGYYKTPRDIEWSITGDGNLVFLQSRPLAVQQDVPDVADVLPSAERGTLLFRAGVTASRGQACGPAYVVDQDHHLEDIPPGAILVLRETMPAAVRILKLVSGVVAELGSVAGHFSTVCREYEIPLLLAVGNKVEEITHGENLSLLADRRELWQGCCLPERKRIPDYVRHASLPYYVRLRGVLDFVTPLNLLDPEGKDFAPESCRSLHDIIRFCHEQAVRAMFFLGDRGSGRAKGKKKLISNLPLDIFFVDVGGGLLENKEDGEGIRIEELRSEPFIALWHGLTHPSVEWQERSHFDWKSFDDIALAGGVASKGSSEFASFAVLGRDYVNLNIRFGYHFTLVDAMCAADSAKNYCQLRFAGGGGDFAGRNLRLLFVETILKSIDFQVSLKGDLLDARLQHLGAEDMLSRLKVVGRLLGVTKLMDMRLKDESMVRELVGEFLSAA